jgi:hypothetical protein
VILSPIISSFSCSEGPNFSRICATSVITEK